MIIPRVAFRYAQAIMGSFPEGEERTKAFADIADVLATGDQSAEFRRFLESPIIDQEKKRAVLMELFETRVQPSVLAAILFLLEKQRESLLLPVLQALLQSRKQEMGIQDVTVRTVIPLRETEAERLREVLGQATGKSVELSEQQSPDLLGGLVVRINDTVYDGSVARQLHLLRMRFVASVE